MTQYNLLAQNSVSRTYLRKPQLPHRSAEAGIESDYRQELEPGAVLKFHFLYSSRLNRPLSPVSNPHQSDTASESSDLQTSYVTPQNSQGLCNVQSFPFLLGQIINHERQKRLLGKEHRAIIEAEVKHASGAILLASQRLQRVLKDSETSVKSRPQEWQDHPLKAPFVCRVSVSSAYPDTDLEFWRSNLQKRLRQRAYRVYKKTEPRTLRRRRGKAQKRAILATPSDSDATEATSTPERRCISCGCSNTPCWRPSWYGNSGLLCNSCGLRYKKIGVRCLNKNCRHIPLRSEFREMKKKVNGNSAIDCIKCGGEVKIRG